MHFQACFWIRGVDLIVGDLTDAKTADTQGSDQFLDEWKTYQKVIDESGILKVTKWFDLRGNHGNILFEFFAFWRNFFLP